MTTFGHRRNGRNHLPAGSAPPADRDTYRRRRDDLADAIAARLDHGLRDDDLADQIRPLMAQLRAATTPAERVEFEAQIRPLVQARQTLAAWR